MSTETLYSQHSFLFPFKWDYIEANKEYKDLSFDERTNLGHIEKLLSNTHWQKSLFNKDESDEDEKDLANYNEYTFFYEHIRKAIYSSDSPTSPKISLFFEHSEYKKNNNKEFTIGIEKNKVLNEYKLEITSVILRLFETGIGIISFHLDNKKHSEFEDILAINDFGRRVYEPFKGAKGNVTANYLKIGDSEETFSINSKLKVIETILGSSFYYYDTNVNIDKHQKRVEFQEIIDDRMYVMSWAGNDQIQNSINWDEDKNTYKYLENDSWYKYIFVDGKDITCQSKTMKKTLIEKSTYNRWVEYGTLYGISRYSWVCLSPSKQNLEKNNAAHIIRTMKSIYYQMTVLALVQRSSIIRFSGEVTRISSLKDDKSFEIIKSIRDLYKNYIQFINRIYFREVTAQEQGIELYNMLLDSMNIERDIKDLDREIEELHNYATLINQEEEANKINNLTKRGFPLVISSYIVGLLGSNFFEANNFRKPEALIKSVLMTLVIGFVILLISNFIYNFFINKGGKNGKTRG